MSRSHAFLVLFIVSLAGCVPVSHEPTPAAVQTVTYKFPVFTPQQETKELQEKGGFQITVIPIQYAESPTQTHEDHVLQTGVRREFKRDGIFVDTPYRVVERTTKQAIGVKPDRVGFQITVNNKLTHVFRGQGVVVQFNVGGRMVAVDQQNYSELSNLILPPRNQQQVTIYGPPLSKLPDSPTPVALMLYDIATATDNAGNPTERQNFEWYYTATMEAREKEASMHTQRVAEPTGPSVTGSAR